MVIGVWRREYNKERQKSLLAGLTPIPIPEANAHEATYNAARLQITPLLKAGGRRLSHH